MPCRALPDDNVARPTMASSKTRTVELWLRCPHQVPPIVARAHKNTRDRRPTGVDSCGAAAADQHAGRLPYAFSHPDFTVGPGVSPDRALVLPLALAGCTAGQDLTVIARRSHQTPKAQLTVTLPGRGPAVNAPASPAFLRNYAPRASLTRSKKLRLFGCRVTSLPRLAANCSKRCRCSSDNFFGTTT